MKENEKTAVLALEQIAIQCSPVSCEEAIVEVGNMLLEAGYIEPPYIEGMLRRNEMLTTYIGNDLAIPHGEYEVKAFVKKTGLAVRVYPEGIDWNGNLVRIVIGIAASNDDHIQILQHIACTLGEMEVVNALVNSDDVAYIHTLLTEVTA